MPESMHPPESLVEEVGLEMLGAAFAALKGISHMISDSGGEDPAAIKKILGAMSAAESVSRERAEAWWKTIPDGARGYWSNPDLSAQHIVATALSRMIYSEEREAEVVFSPAVTVTSMYFEAFAAAMVVCHAYQSINEIAAIGAESLDGDLDPRCVNSIFCAIEKAERAGE